MMTDAKALGIQGKTNGFFFADLFIRLFADHVADLLYRAVSMAEFGSASVESLFLRVGRADHRFFNAFFHHVGIRVWFFN